MLLVAIIIRQKKKPQLKLRIITRCHEKIVFMKHEKFDIYELQLGLIEDDSGLRKLLSGIGNRSILLLEDFLKHHLN